VYVPASRAASANIAVVIRSTAPDPLALVPAIRAEVARIDRSQPIHDVAAMTKVLFDDLAGTYVLTALLTSIALIALCLSAAGVYGLVAYSVAQGAREIGLRVALGARPGMIVRMVVATGAKPVAVGSLLGLVVAALLTFGIGLSVPGVDPRDPSTYIAVTLTIVMVALTASYLPARQAAIIDPAVTLRQ
jgi:putative ABC transport system permease protein